MVQPRLLVSHGRNDHAPGGLDVHVRHFRLSRRFRVYLLHMKVNMTDLEITKLCAQAMGLSLENDADSRMSRDMLMFYEGKTYHVYDPLHDDAQAMALVKWLRQHGRISIHSDRLVFYKPP